MRLWGWVAVGAMLLAAPYAQQARAQQRIIYDDDCSNDVDCVATLPILYQLEDRGEIKILAMVADSVNPDSAPVLKLFAKYGDHAQTPIGANLSKQPSTALCALTAMTRKDPKFVIRQMSELPGLCYQQTA